MYKWAVQLIITSAQPGLNGGVPLAQLVDLDKRYKATPSCIPVSGPPPAKSTLFFTAHAQVVAPPLLYSSQLRESSQDGKLSL